MEKKVIKKSKVVKDVIDNKRKHVVRKVKKTDEKSSVPEVEPFKDRFKRFVSSYLFLYPVFIVLLAMVIILAIMVINKDNKQEVNKGDIVFSIIEKNTNNSFNVSLKGLIGRKYALKVTNYRGNTLCEEDLPYAIHVMNPSDVQIEILKDGGIDNLMVDQHNTLIQAEALGCNRKDEAIYYFKILNSDKIKDSDTLQIEVIS